MTKKNFYSLFYVFTHFTAELSVLCLLIKNYTNLCDNKEFLTWDPELRYIYSLELLDSLRRLEVVNFVKLLFDTPTWPPLRNLLHVILFSFLGHSPEIDVYLSLSQFLILDSFLAYVAWRLLKGYLAKWIGLLISKVLYLSPTFLLYSFSGMLEVQGALFETFAVVFFGLSHRKIKSLRSMKLFGFSFLGLYFTKYPYGYMFLLAIGFILIIQSYQEVKKIILKFIQRRWTSFIPIFVASGLAIVYLFLPKTYLIKKIPKYFKFTIGSLAFLTLGIFIWQEQKFIQRTSFRIYSYIVWGILPVGIWTFIHPDRFGSSYGTITHIQKEGHLVGEVVIKDWKYYTHFLESLFNDVWIESKIGVWFGIMVAMILIFQWQSIRKKRKISFSVSCLLIIFLQIFQLTFLTENHQSRHVYHLIPILILVVLISFREVKVKLFKYVVLFSLLLIGISIGKKLPDYFRKTYLCFSGQGDFYKPILSLKPYLDRLITKDIYLVNNIPEGHLYRVNVEYVTAKLSYDKGFKYYKKIPSYRDFVVLVVGNKCVDSFENFKPIDEITTNEFCLQTFQ